MAYHYTINWDEIDIQDSNTNTWWNEKLWAQIFGMMIFFTFSYFLDCIFLYPDDTWVFNYNLFFQLLIVNAGPIILYALKIQFNLKKVISKQKVEEHISSIIEEKDKEIEALKLELSDKCATLEANQEALDEIDDYSGE